MNNDDTLAKELQNEEFQVLESIYPDYIAQRTEDAIRLEIPVELGEQTSVTLQSEAPLSDVNLELSYLPPLLLDIALPTSYPSRTPPAIRSIHVTHFWMTRTAELAGKLLGLWTKGDGVLCEWVETIRSGEFLQTLQMIDTSRILRIACTAPQTLAPLLQSFDSSSAELLFSNTSYSCSICFSSLKGSRCILLQCSHVFCRECLQDFWSLCIKEGSVERVVCPEPSCVKKYREASEEELRRVVSDEEVRRWKWLRVKKAMEKDPSIVHCPVPTCQAPVPKSSEDTEGTGWDRFRNCESCGFDFCAFCKRTWHGPITACPKKVSLALVEQYLALPEGSSARKELERKFGAGVVTKLCREYLDEKSTMELLENSTTGCPGCNVRVEKSEGCNHMTCWKCGMHFCYRCAEVLNPINPYGHFNNSKSKCDGKLFDRVDEPMDFEVLPYL